MKGLITDGKGNVSLREDLPRPDIGDYDALVQTVGCGICNGTELKIMDGHLKGVSTYPAVLGHEAVGRVIETGKKVKYYKVGDLVLRPGLCDNDKYYSLWGGFSEFTTVADCMSMEEDGITIEDVSLKSRIVVPPFIDEVEASMLITLEEVYSAAKRLAVCEGMRIVIMGCGPVGIAMANFCRLLGARSIILGGHHEARMSKALEVGADVVVNTRNEDIVEKVRNYMGAADLFIDAVGNGGTLSQGLRCIKPGGTIGIYGIGLKNDQMIDWEHSDYSWKIQSVQWPDYGHLVTIQNEVLNYVKEGKVNLSDYVTHKIPIEHYEDGFALIRKRQGLKIVLTF